MSVCHVVQVTGSITYNGKGFDQFRAAHTAAYVDQNDLHQPELTVRETFDFAARCQGVGHKAGGPITAVWLAGWLSVRPSVRPSVRLSVCLSVSLSVCLSVCPSVCLPVTCIAASLLVTEFRQQGEILDHAPCAVKCIVTLPFQLLFRLISLCHIDR